MIDERKPEKPETPGLAEVSPKFVREAEAAVEAAASTDEALSTFWQEHERLTAQYGEAVEKTDLAFTTKRAITETETPEYDAAVAAHEAASQHQQETSDAIVATEIRMVEVPAHTVAGVLFKLRTVGIEIADDGTVRNGVLDEASLDSEQRLTLSALGDLERLVGEISAIEDPVIVLKREWQARWERYESETDESEEVTDPLHDRVNETAYEIFQTPATTPAGIAFKLVLWARQHIGHGAFGAGWSKPPVSAYNSLDLDNLPVVSALHDLERLEPGWRPQNVTLL